MTVKDALKLAIDSGNMVAMGYLGDLTDAELFHRPFPGCNHINWQVGHLIQSEHDLTEKASPGSMKPLPSGFAEKYTPETSRSDDPRDFCSKDELLRAAAEQRASTLAALANIDEAKLDLPTGVEYAPTIGALFSLQGSHWLMHAGQWAVIRRQLGRPPLF